MKLTNWFPPDVKPVHEGEYSTDDDLPNDHLRRWWDGRLWSKAYRDDDPEPVKRAPRRSPAAFLWQDTIRWRGLAGDPNARGSA